MLLWTVVVLTDIGTQGITDISFKVPGVLLRAAVVLTDISFKIPGV